LRRQAIVKLSAIGDVVHTLPLLEVLKKEFSNTRIDWVVEEEASQMIEGHSAIDQVIVSRRKSWQKRLLKKGQFKPVIREILQFLREIRSHEYDLVIDVHGLLKSGILTALARGKRKIGMSGATEGGWLFLNERSVPVDYNQHAIERYLKLAEYLECDPISWKGDIPVFEPDKRFINQLSNTNGLGKRPLVAMNPVARWKTKLWKNDRFAVLADRLRRDLVCEIIFTGSKDDRATIEDISKMMEKKPINLAGRTSLKELAYLYTKCAALVTTDTGPMHMAAAMGCQVVALFGPTAPWRTGPYGMGHKVIRTGVECSPCFKKRCDDLICMKHISVENVFEAVKDIVLGNQEVRGQGKGLRTKD
jgi:3-deoxy-D-manno-octulosonic-acid transferase/heptosyltransferase-1